jgi:hypothetical protein
MEDCGCCGAYHPRDFEGDCRNDDFRYHFEDMANLLKAAPDLLEACQTALNSMWRCNSITFDKEGFDKAVIKLENAIKKATIPPKNCL